MDSFDLFPLCCILNGRFLCVHGGISPEFKTVYLYKDIINIYRVKNIKVDDV